MAKFQIDHMKMKEKMVKVNPSVFAVAYAHCVLSGVIRVQTWKVSPFAMYAVVKLYNEATWVNIP